jgi:hypothetical protein
LLDGLGLTRTLELLGAGIVAAVIVTLFLPETKGARLEGP